MGILEQLLAIARVTFAESIRQPVVAVVGIAGVLILILGNALFAFTLEDDQRMLVEIGLSSIFVMGLLLAGLLATSVLTREIENRTVLTVISKPVPRVVLLLGKYLGVLAAIVLAYGFLTATFMLVVRHGTMPTVATPYQAPVITFGLAAALLAGGFAVFANFFWGWSFGATLVGVGTPLLLLAFAMALPFRADWSVPPTVPPPPPVPGARVESLGWLVGKNLNWEVWKAAAAGGLALSVLTAIAVALSARLGLVLTMVGTVAVFAVGMLSEWVLARRLAALDALFARTGGAGHWWDGDHITWWTCRSLQAVIPDFQLFFLADAVNQRKTITFLARTEGGDLSWYGAGLVAYAVVLIAMALGLGTILFQRREVG